MPQTHAHLCPASRPFIRGPTVVVLWIHRAEAICAGGRDGRHGMSHPFTVLSCLRSRCAGCRTWSPSIRANWGAVRVFRWRAHRVLRRPGWEISFCVCCGASECVARKQFLTGNPPKKHVRGTMRDYSTRGTGRRTALGVEWVGVENAYAIDDAACVLSVA
jgi:hypothetical protein